MNSSDQPYNWIDIEYTNPITYFNVKSNHSTSTMNQQHESSTMRGRELDYKTNRFSHIMGPNNGLSKSGEESNAESNTESFESSAVGKSSGGSPHPIPRNRFEDESVLNFDEHAGYNLMHQPRQQQQQRHQSYYQPNLQINTSPAAYVAVPCGYHRMVEPIASYPGGPFTPTLLIPPGYQPEVKPYIYMDGSLMYHSPYTTAYTAPYPEVYHNNSPALDYMFRNVEDPMSNNIHRYNNTTTTTVPPMECSPAVDMTKTTCYRGALRTTSDSLTDELNNNNGVDNLDLQSIPVKTSIQSNKNCVKANNKNLRKIELTKRRVKSICPARLALARDHLKEDMELNSEKQPVESILVYWMTRELRTIHNHSLSHAQAVANEHRVPLVVYFSPMHTPFPNRRQANWRIRGMIDVQVELEKCNITLISEIERDWPVLKSLLIKFDVINIITDTYPLNIMNEFRDEVKEFLPLTTNFQEIDAHNVVPIWVTSKKRETRARDFRQKLRAAMSTFKLYHLPVELTKHAYLFGGIHHLTQFKNAHLNSPRAVMTLLSLDIPQFERDENVLPCDWAEPGQKEGLRALNRWCSHKINGYAKFRNDPHMQAVSHLSPYLNCGFVSAQYVLCKIEQTTTAKQADKQRFKNEILTWKELSDNFTYYDKNYSDVMAFPSWASKSQSEKCNEPRDCIYTREELENFKVYDSLWNACQKELAMFGKIHTTLRLYWAKKLIEWSESPEGALEMCNYLNDKWGIDASDPIGYCSSSWAIGGTLDRPFPDRPVYGKIRYFTRKGMERKFDVKRWCEKVDFAWKAYNQPGRIDSETGTSYKFLYEQDDDARLNFLMERKEWKEKNRARGENYESLSGDDEES